MWIQRGDTRIGAYVIQMRRNEEEDLPRYDFIARARMEIVAFNISVPVELDMEVAMNDGFELETFQGRLVVSGQPIQVEGFTEELKLYFRMKGAEPFVTGGGFVSVSTLGKPVMLAAAIRPVITQSADLKVGKKWKTRASNPLTGRAEVLVTVEVVARETIEIGGEQVRAFRIVERTDQMVTTSWYDEDGQILKSDLGNGLVLIRGPRKVISEQFPELDLPPQFDPIDRAAIRREADEQGEVKMTNLLPWWPNL